MTIANKVAIVTGASSGLGKAVTELLAAEQVIVFALARNIQNVELPKSVTKLTLNIRDLQNLDEVFQSIDQQTSRIDFLVNCAGRSLTKALEETTREEIMDVFGVNLKGNIYVAQEVYRRMISHQSGHIVNVISTSGLKGRELETIYCASKWGLRGFTESLRLAALAHKIRVSAVYPGGMKSENFWQAEPTKNLNGYMEPKLVAEQIVNLLKTDPAISPTELIIERN